MNSRLLPVIPALVAILLAFAWNWQRSPKIREDLPPLDSAAVVLPSTNWVVWYGEDTRIYRMLAGNNYRELYTALRQSLEEDRGRLEVLTAGYLTTELVPVATELRPRLKPFIGELFGVGVGFSRLWLGLKAADQATEELPQEGNTSERLESQVRIPLAENVLEQFRAEVLGKGDAQRLVREATDRVFGLLRTDLLQACSRYDRAFRQFILNTYGTVEALEGEGGWRPDPSWQPVTATFMSLCQGLRRAQSGVGPRAEAAVAQSFAALEGKVRAQAFESVETPARAAAKVSLASTRYRSTLESLGLSQNWARRPALWGAYITSPWTVTRSVLDRLGGSVNQTSLETNLTTSLDELVTDLGQRLLIVGKEYLHAELERIVLGVEARSEGAWSRQ